MTTPNDNIAVPSELLQKIFESLDSRCGTNAPERTEIIPALLELLDAPAVEPVAWGDVKTRPDGKRYCRAVATTDQSHLGYLPLSTAPQAQQHSKAVKLTDEEVYKVVRSTQPHLDDTSRDWAQHFAECKYWLSAAHNIGDEK